MAKNSVIGALRAMLSLDTAEFEEGDTRARRKSKALERVLDRRFTKMAKSTRKVGKALSKNISLPIAAAATAFSAAAHKIATDSRDIKNSAQVAGEGFEEFQRQAHAAKTVGIEFDKLGDIFKDMRDRVGDFLATGGGPMADFFENIGPKVGVTAQNFKDLSGKDALQLYFDSLRKANVSQEEMVFYLEAMASDATNLIPLLEQNGKQFERLGESANIVTSEDQARFEKYLEAQRKLGEAGEKLVIAFVNSGLLDTITELVVQFADWTSDLAETNPTLLKVGAAAAGVLAVLGPILSVVSTLLPLLKYAPAVLRAVGVAFRFMLGPIGLVLLAIEGIYLAWKNWDKIEPILRNLYQGVKTWIIDKLGAVWRKVQKDIDDVIGLFKGMYTAIVGNSYVPDMVDGIDDEMSRLDAVMVRPAKKSAEEVKQAMRDMAQETRSLLARLFPEIEAARQLVADRRLIDGSNLSDADKRRARFRLVGGGGKGNFEIAALGQGPLREAEKVEQAAERMSDALREQADKARVQTVRIADSFKDMANQAMSALRSMVDGIRSGDFLSILEGVLGIFSSLGGAGVLGGKVQGFLNQPLPGFANGGSIRLGGMSGIDRNILSLNGSPIARVSRGEMAHITPANDSGRRGGVTNIYYTLPSDEFWNRVDAQADGRVSMARRGIAAEAVAASGAAFAKRQSKRFS